jgi:hypothetical protein
MINCLDDVILARQYLALSDKSKRNFQEYVLNPGKLPADTGPAAPGRKSSYTMAELAAASFPEPKWAVPSIIPVVLSFLAGRPKLGKSWLGLQIAHAVGTGGYALGMKVDQGKALYLALEDSPRRLKERAEKQRIPADAQIVFETTWLPFPNGGLVDLQNCVLAGGFSLVVIDTLSRAVGSSDQLDLAIMTDLLGNLQQMALTYEVAVLAIDHHRKANGMVQSPVDDILGSTAKSAVADAAFGFYREQGKQGATFKITGRDVEERELALEWDGITCTWISLGNAGEVREDTLKAEILKAIRELQEDGQPATNKRIADHLDTNKGSINHLLADLVAAGKIRKGFKSGREIPYELIDKPGEVSQPSQPYQPSQPPQLFDNEGENE